MIPSWSPHQTLRSAAVPGSACGGRPGASSSPPNRGCSARRRRRVVLFYNHSNLYAAARVRVCVCELNIRGRGAAASSIFLPQLLCPPPHPPPPLRGSSCSLSSVSSQSNFLSVSGQICNSFRSFLRRVSAVGFLLLSLSLRARGHTRVDDVTRGRLAHSGFAVRPPRDADWPAAENLRSIAPAQTCRQRSTSACDVTGDLAPSLSGVRRNQDRKPVRSLLSIKIRHSREA